MSSAAGTSTKKRKADEISEDEEESAKNEVPHLPAPVWGGILDFMPYGEVRSALLVGKHIAVEAIKYVKTINVLKPSEMHVRASRRFPNIEEVRILCLLQGSGEFDEDGEEIYTLSQETAYSATPFLTCFPKLKEAFIGGWQKYRHEDDRIEKFLTEYDDYCSRPNDHEEIFRGLVVCLGGAFKTGLLSQDVTIEGVNPFNWQTVRPCRSRHAHETDSCSWCRSICKQFPLTHVLPKGFMMNIDQSIARWYCLNKRELWTIINGRSGGKQAIQEASEEMLCGILFTHETGLHRRKIVVLDPDGSCLESISPDVKKHMQDENLDKLSVWGLSESSLSKIDEMIKAGFDPTRVREEYLLSQLTSSLYYVAASQGVCNVWTKSTVAELSCRGFPVDSITTVDY